MSPDITPVVRPNPTVEIIRCAVNAAHAMGLTVSTVPDLGVHCTSTLERAATEPTNPVDTPRSLIAELLDSLTTSQALEALADTCRARAAKLPADLADDLTVVEHTLREMAAEMRGVG
jgi:hypothetical protein